MLALELLRAPSSGALKRQSNSIRRCLPLVRAYFISTIYAGGYVISIHEPVEII